MAGWSTARITLAVSLVTLTFCSAAIIREVQDWQEAQDEDLKKYVGETNLRIITTWLPTECPKQVEQGDTVEVKYVVKLTDNTGFEPATFQFRVGHGQVVEGWDKGLIGACILENHRLVVPPELAYGENEYEPDKDDPNAPQVHIKPNSVIVFDTQVLSITPHKQEDSSPR